MELSSLQYVAAIVTILGAIVLLLKALWKHTINKQGNFQLSFIDHFPLPEFQGDPKEDAPDSIKILPFGSHKLFLKVVALHGFQVKKTNLRCLNSDHTNASKSNVTITDMVDPFHHSIFRVMTDGNWGMEGEYSDVRVIAKGSGLYYEITLNAMQNWSGYLSFRAEDPSALRSWVRHSIEIRDGADQLPAYVKYTVPGTFQATVPKLRLEFRENDNRFLRREAHHSTHSTGKKYTGSIAVFNESPESVDQVRIVIGSIFPTQQGARNFNVISKAQLGTGISIAPQDRQFITLFEFTEISNDCLLRVECEVAIPGAGEEFLMKVRATGRNVSEPERITLRFGFRNGEFFLNKE